MLARLAGAAADSQPARHCPASPLTGDASLSAHLPLLIRGTRLPSPPHGRNAAAPDKSTPTPPHPSRPDSSFSSLPPPYGTLPPSHLEASAERTASPCSLAVPPFFSLLNLALSSLPRDTARLRLPGAGSCRLEPLAADLSLTGWAVPPSPPPFNCLAGARTTALLNGRCSRRGGACARASPDSGAARRVRRLSARPPALPRARARALPAAASRASARGAGGSAEPSGSRPLLAGGGGGRGAAVPRRAGRSRDASPPGAHRRRQPRGQLLLGGQRRGHPLHGNGGDARGEAGAPGLRRARVGEGGRAFGRPEESGGRGWRGLTCRAGAGCGQGGLRALGPGSEIAR